MNNLKQYETDQRPKFIKLIAQMNEMHAKMGGRDNRPERIALEKCMAILQAEADRSLKEWLDSGN